MTTCCSETSHIAQHDVHGPHQCLAKKRASIVKLFVDQDFSWALVAALDYFCDIHCRQYDKWWLPHIANKISALHEYLTSPLLIGR